MRRSTLRMRLTLLYAGAFLLAGAILVVLMYFSLDQWLERRPGPALRRILMENLVEPAHGHPLASENIYAALLDQAERQRRDTLHNMLGWSLAALAAVGVAAAGFGWMLAGRVLHPLQHITATARRVADRNLHERIALAGPPDEIKDLADTFDAMLERLDRAFDSQRRFVANASHELRTPLAINRTLLEVALDDPQAPPELRQLGNTLLEVNQRHERLIDGLLVLAGSEQHLTEVRHTDLAELAARAVAAVPAGPVDVRADLSPTPVAGDPILLERLAHNLIDNAVRYNRPEAGWVTVTTTTTGNTVHLTVENTGPTVPAFDVDSLFEPFRRLNGDRPEHGTGRRGAGLGLSIVRSVAGAHGGTVTATARPDGGLSVTVTLPALR
ncbi:sensor histidine kinase [Nocardia sp. alder85J]|uniref:sensor histidine kinase n=1 Tax=Nocardia sp. alder85J TaxID=2862949 RepID=UPI001CD303EC|nr:HAMP domain-containing sensor histidine kinase [Nocardia sp. alder85J]MCX4096885.1 HAMP domain-containing sensor histidine kinase [Nocardia sp. alder85J]